MAILIVSKVSKTSSCRVLERFDASHKHAMGNVYLRKIQAGIVVNRVTIVDNNKVCLFLSVVFPTTQGFEVVRTEPENGQQVCQQLGAVMKTHHPHRRLRPVDVP